MTELFFLTHQALHLGFHATHDKLVKLNQDLGRIQLLYQDTVRQHGDGDNEELVRNIKRQMDKGRWWGAEMGCVGLKWGVFLAQVPVLAVQVFLTGEFQCIPSVLVNGITVLLRHGFPCQCHKAAVSSAVGVVNSAVKRKVAAFYTDTQSILLVRRSGLFWA